MHSSMGGGNAWMKIMGINEPMAKRGQKKGAAEGILGWAEKSDLRKVICWRPDKTEKSNDETKKTGETPEARSDKRKRVKIEKIREKRLIMRNKCQLLSTFCTISTSVSTSVSTNVDTSVSTRASTRSVLSASVSVLSVPLLVLSTPVAMPVPSGPVPKRWVRVSILELHWGLQKLVEKRKKKRWRKKSAANYEAEIPLLDQTPIVTFPLYPKLLIALPYYCCRCPTTFFFFRESLLSFLNFFFINIENTQIILNFDFQGGFSLGLPLKS